jgi:hypothetical protein
MTKDNATHQIRIEAAGYTSKVETITFERDRSMDVALMKDAGASDKQVHHPVGGPVGGPVVPADDMARTPGKRQQRTLDTSNPYAK